MEENITISLFGILKQCLNDGFSQRKSGNREKAACSLHFISKNEIRYKSERRTNIVIAFVNKREILVCLVSVSSQP